MDNPQPQESDPEQEELVREAARLLNTKIKQYKFDDVKDILESGEFPIDFPVTDTQMSALSLACSMADTSP